jgi:DNA-binding transcriptional regulator LsrR (DeoR family)
MNPDDLLTRIAWLYYIEELTQKEIAQRFNMSRVKVLRLLKKARDKGLVEIRIAGVQTSHLLLEKSLRLEFGLVEAIVIPTPVRPQDLRPALGEAAAAYLRRVARPGLVVGLGMGRTLAEIPGYLEPQDQTTCRFIEMVGGIGRGVSFDSYKVSSLLSDRCGGEVEHIYTPVIVESAATRQALLADPQIKSVLDRAAGCDLALVGVGTVDLDSFLYQAGYADEACIVALQQAGAVGDVLGHFFDLAGRPVRNFIDERLIGLALEDLKRIPMVVCVAGGVEKTGSLQGALAGRYMNALITDETTAWALLNEQKESWE